MRLRTWLGAAALLVAGSLATSLDAHDGDGNPVGFYAGPSHRGVVPPEGTVLQSQELGLGSSGMTLLSLVSTNDLGDTGPNDIWGYVSPSGREYAIMGSDSFTHFVEVTDPQNPVIVTSISGPSSGWRDMKTFGTYSYSVSEGGGGIQVFDLSQIDSGTVNLVNTVTTGGSTNSHNVAVDTTSGYLYRLGTGSGMLVYDLNPNPAAPQFVASWNVKYVHDAQMVTYPGGQEYAFLATGSDLTILNVTNKSNMSVVRTIAYPGEAYAHQVWISDDRQYAYLTDELDETSFGIPTTGHVFDISPLGSAFHVGTYTNGNSSTDHNLFIIGDTIFSANYASGLRVFDKSADPTNPVEVAYYDTYPSSDAAGFSGMWGTYPFLPSGNIICSDRSRGLFTLRLGNPTLTIAFPNGAPDELDPGGQSEIVTISEIAPGSIVPGTEELHYDAGGNGLVTVPLVDLGGGTYRADFPPLTCGDSVKYFVSAESTDGLTWFDPPTAPSTLYAALAAESLLSVFNDDMESDQGWTGGAAGDDASTGIWTRVDPIGTGPQPEDDHTLAGTLCWVTGQGPVGGSIGDNDVDNGTTTLLTPIFDLSGMTAPTISYWRWYSNDGNGVVDDTFTIRISSGPPTGFVTVESIGPGHPEASGGWVQHQFLVSDYVTPTANVRMRFEASDLGSGSIVEAAIDDFRIDDLVCGSASTYCTAKVASPGCVPAIGFAGIPSASNPNPFDVTATQVVNQKNGLLFYGYAQDALPFQGGTLCVQPPLRRTGIQNSGGSGGNNCTGSLTFDFNAHIQSGLDPFLVVGAAAYLQYWFRDPADAFGIGLSDAAQLTVQP